MSTDNKEAIVTTLKNILSRKCVGLYDDIVPFDLHSLPEQNLSAMLALNYNSKDVDSVMTMWDELGLLEFEPQRITSSNKPTLCIKPNKYLCMANKYGFEVTTKPDGNGEYVTSSSYRADMLFNTPLGVSLCDTLIGYMLWWAALVEVGFKFPNFTQAFNDNMSVIKDFLHDTMQEWEYELPGYRWTDVEEYISHDFEMNHYERKLYEILGQDSKIVARFAMGLKSIQVETASPRTNSVITLTMKLPAVSVGLDENSDSYLETAGKIYTHLSSRNYIERLTLFALALSGIHLDFNGWTAEHVGKLRPVNVPGIVTVRTADAIYDQKPDPY